MAKERTRRKLSAILSVDAVGYSRLMHADEASTIRTLEDSKRLMSELIEQFKGRVVDAPGDNLLAEFASIVDATECAVKIQRKLKFRNAALPRNRRMEFRIGINLGDVVEEGDRIYGDGVNIAARVEKMAEPGGICISGAAYDHVENKLELEYKNLGEHKTKNIAKPVRVYRISIETEAPDPQVHKKIELPDKPSIAVLPFTNMSDDPKQQYFSDGMAEDLMTDLSKISGLLVISRNSAFAYKGKSIEAKQIADQLGVRYLLEGSVRKAGEQVRINAQLIDATTDHHLWAERYDGKMDNIFDLQDKITQKIVAALAVKLAKGEQRHLASRETSSIAAYDAFLKGMDGLSRTSANQTARALSYFEKAIEIDPNYGRAYAGLAIAYDDARRMGMWEHLGISFQENSLFVHHYLNLGMKNPTSFARVIYGTNLALERRFEEAITEIEQAIILDPNDSRSNWMMSGVLTWGGRPQEGVEHAEKALRIDPGCVY
jgi:TolB-like protein